MFKWTTMETANVRLTVKYIGTADIILLEYDKRNVFVVKRKVNILFNYIYRKILESVVIGRCYLGRF